MKKKNNILIAFVLNLLFSVFELIGGLFTGSIAILSDALHDLGDGIGIGISYFCERKSQKYPDESYTYGYYRYSVLGGWITTIILLIGSVAVIYNSILRLFQPVQVNEKGMIFLAVVGVLVNGAAAFFTRHGHSVNQKAVNLHMLEDVLGWIVVFIGAVIMGFTDFVYLDSILSIGVTVFILYHAVKNLVVIVNVFLERAPKGVGIAEIKEEILGIEGVVDLHHFHLRSLDGHHHEATMHLVVHGDSANVKKRVREYLLSKDIVHVTVETEEQKGNCCDEFCHIHEVLGEDHHHESR